MIARIMSLFLLVSTSLSAQIIQIDEKKGFKDFKIGNDKSKYTDIRRVGNKLKSPLDLKFYEYIHPEKYPVFSYNNSRIILGFDNLNKLSSIQIDIKNIEDIKDLINNFSILFGNDYVKQEYSDNVTVYAWFGKKIILSIKYPVSEFTQIMIVPFKTINKNIESGF